MADLAIRLPRGVAGLIAVRSNLGARLRDAAKKKA
jgi:hypothetical protein